MSEKNVEVEEDKDSSVDEYSSDREVEGESNEREKKTENNERGREVTDTGLADAFVTERADPAKVKEWKKSKEGKIVRKRVQRAHFRIDLDLKSEEDLKELEEVVLTFDENRKKQYNWEARYSNPSEGENGKELELGERNERDKRLYMKILTYKWMAQGKVNRALEWGKRESELKRKLIRREYSGYFLIDSAFWQGYSLAELAQYGRDSTWLLNKIYETAKEIRCDRNREDNIALIAGAYASKGYFTRARNIIKNDIENSKKATDKARTQLAIALGKNGYVDEACNIIEDLPKITNFDKKEPKRRAIANLEEEILEEKGGDYLAELFVEMPWIESRLYILLGKLGKKDKDDLARELGFAVVNQQPLLDARGQVFRTTFQLDSSKYEKYLEEGQIHEELRKEFLEEGCLLGKDAQLSKDGEMLLGKEWVVSEGENIQYLIIQKDDRLSIRIGTKMMQTPAEFFLWLMTGKTTKEKIQDARKK